MSAINVPAEGLFAEKTWRIAPQPFALGPAHVELLGKARHRPAPVQHACNLLYRQSARGKAHPWVAPLLDAGKPPELVALSRHEKVKGHVPAVIRPDLILTKEGFALSEIDSVRAASASPRGWGTYSALGGKRPRGADGMRTGFGAVLGDGDVLIPRKAPGTAPRWSGSSARTA